MILAYKYLSAANDIVFVFPHIPKNQLTGKLEHAVVGGTQYLTISSELYVPLTDEIINMLTTVQRLVVGVSDYASFEILFVGSVDLDRMDIGRIMAYYEMELIAIGGTAHSEAV